MVVSVSELKSMLHFNEDVFIKSHILVVSALMEHMPRISNPESHSKSIDIFNEVTETSLDVIRNSCD